FQYNYSHDNDGGFMLICTPGNSYNEDTVIRYNISQNDGISTARVFHFGGGAKNTLVYNNTIYVGPEQNLPLLLFTEWNHGNASGTKFYNNIFYVDGHVTYDWGKSTNTVFERNVFYGAHGEIPPDPQAITNRPPLLKPGSGAVGFVSLNGYHLRKDADFPLGRIVPDNGGLNFFGNRVPQDSPPCIGAAESAH
ncbi:MAG TPA: right-handed parallel beta-helix repeat-containing protein, partial [Verrucomicrobiae bacterium]|nr:right-handed parallel beta-helix repeat-containing protein [Verrucomicrobiae bacterium]